jgi:hypothetical protein
MNTAIGICIIVILLYIRSRQKKDQAFEVLCIQVKETLRDQNRKMTAPDINNFTKIGDRNLVKEICEYLFLHGQVKRTGNYRYYIEISESKKKMDSLENETNPKSDPDEFPTYRYSGKKSSERKTGQTNDDLDTSDINSKLEKQKSKKSIKDSKKIPAWKKIKTGMESFGPSYEAKYGEIMEYCNKHYGEVKKSTFRTYIISCTVNHSSRVHYSPNKKERTELLDNDVLYQVEEGLVTLYDPKKHGDWHIKIGDDGKLHPVKP